MEEDRRNLEEDQRREGMQSTEDWGTPEGVGGPGTEDWERPEGVCGPEYCREEWGRPPQSHYDAEKKRIKALEEIMEKRRDYERRKAY